MKVFYFIICLVLLYQCRNAQHSQDQTSIHITIKEDFQGVSADSLFSSVTYIPLETSKNSLLVSINKIHIQDSTIYILDKKQKIIFFLMKFCHFQKKPYLCIAFEKNSLVAQLVRAADC